jgi:precorrin-8X/cobalt-precorrin-8 methylmutase
VPLFDSYLMVDWSAASTPKRGKDSIWWALESRGRPPRVGNPATRAEARDDIVRILEEAATEGRRILAGFDFPFGFPRGAALAIAGEPSQKALWAKLAECIEDADGNANNRFAAASGLNSLFAEPGPFWGHPNGRTFSALFPTRGPVVASHPPARRHAEAALRTPKTVWQLSGAGSVGGQVLVGIPFLKRLIDSPRLRGRVAVWPFDTGLQTDDRPIVLAEIYPSLLKVARRDGEPLDRTQVTTLARWFAEWDTQGDLKAAFELPDITDVGMRSDIVREEGWILGAGCPRPPLKPSAAPTAFAYIRDPSEITRRSFQAIAEETDLAGLPADLAPVAARIVHASGMPDIVADLVCSPGAAAIGRAALAAGAPIVCDVKMVAAGLMAKRMPAQNRIVVAIDRKRAAERAAQTGQTRSAAGMEFAAGSLNGAVVVIGNAPTALFRLLELVADGAGRPALVLGFPVGFVGAAESKVALADNQLGVPFIALKGRRGGSAMAAAALNALILEEAP